MEEIDDLREILSEHAYLPDMVVLDLSQPVRRIFSVFEPDPSNLIGPEYVIDRAIEACSSRTTAMRDISKFAQSLIKDVVETRERQSHLVQELVPAEFRRHNHGEWPWPPVYFEHAIMLEQATLDIFDEFVKLKLYLNNQYLPYRYEHMFGGNAVVLKKYQTAEEFFDRIAYLNA